MARIVSNVPPGYNMLPELNGYAAHSGLHFWSKDAEGGSLIYGFQSDERPASERRSAWRGDRHLR
jgi:hypothetical protein